MIWLGVLGALVAVAAIAALALLRGGRASGVEPTVRRRQAGPAAVPHAGTTGDRLREVVARQRERAGRLTAGHVQLIDVGAMVEGAAVAGLSPAKALAVAEEVARRMIRTGDVLVRMDPDGLAILFDGLSREEAEEKSRQIADATLAALGEIGSGGRYLAEGFGYELDELLDGAVIDTVEDLIRFVHIAHRTYVSRQRGLARQLERGLRLVTREIRAGAGGVVLGLEVVVCRSGERDGRPEIEEVGFAPLDPAAGAETDCVVLEKLGAAVAGRLIRGNDPLYVPARLASLVNPLYLANLHAALDALPPLVRQRLVLVLDPGQGAIRAVLPRAQELVRSRLAAVALRVVDPVADVAAAAAAGIATVVMDAPRLRHASAVEAAVQFRELARHAGLTPLVFGAEDAVASLTGGIAHSRAG